jgi:hypothetical protein
MERRTFLAMVSGSLLAAPLAGLYDPFAFVGTASDPST